MDVKTLTRGCQGAVKMFEVYPGGVTRVSRTCHEGDKRLSRD